MSEASPREASPSEAFRRAPRAPNPSAPDPSAPNPSSARLGEAASPSAANEAALAARLQELRDAFAAPFRLARPGAPPPVERFVGIVAEGRGYALPLAAVSELIACPPLTPLPPLGRARAGGLRGICQHRGDLIAVWRLRALLGLAGQAHEPWLLRLRDLPDAALAVEAVSGYLEVEASALQRAPVDASEPACAGRIDTPEGALIWLDARELVRALGPERGRPLGADRAPGAEPEASA